MPFSGQGAAAGAAAGSAFGPWGTVIGGVAGGFMGGQGQSAAPPAPVYMPPVSTIPGGSNAYGGYYVDPMSGQMTQYNNNSPTSPSDLQNQMTMAALQGQQVTGAGSQEGASSASALAQMQAQMASLNAATKPPDYAQMYQKYMQDPQGPAVGGQKLAQAWQQANMQYKANFQQLNQQRATLQQNIDNLTQAQKSIGEAGAGGGTANNPMLQFLGQGKYDNIANTINMNANNAALGNQQSLASRGLGASSLSDMTARQDALQRGATLGNTLQNVGQQDFNSRLGMLQYLQGAQGQSFNQGLESNQASLAGNQLAMGIGQNYANAQDQRNATNTGLTNAYNMAGYNNQLMNQNYNQQGLSSLGGVAGATDWSKMFSGSPSSGGGSSTGGNLATNPAYNGGSSSPMNPYSYNPNSAFTTNMKAAG